MGTAVGDSITLIPAFNEDTFTYTAPVTNEIDEVTLTATKSDSNAIVAFTDDDDPSTPNEATLDLNIGDNTLTVTVTAADTTTETYTITVTREAPPVEVTISWGLMPAGLSPGDQFRLLFTSSTSRNATSTDIEDLQQLRPEPRRKQAMTTSKHTATDSRVVGCTQDRRRPRQYGHPLQQHAQRRPHLLGHRQQSRRRLRGLLRQHMG